MTIAIGLLERLIGAFLPGLIRMIAHVESDKKETFVRLLSSLCDAYLEQDRKTFDRLLQYADLPENWRGALSLAVWGNDVDPD